MERSKNQAVYRYLPGMWVSDNSDIGRTITAEIDNWNWRDMAGIYERFIVGEIKRQIQMFEDRGGDITSFDISPGARSLRIVEAAEREGVADIRGTISPLVFYCSSCGHVFSMRNASHVDKSIWQCKVCHKYSVKQLQMVYACECGHAEPIRIPYVKGVDQFKYRPNETPYKMFYKDGKSEKAAEFILPCPTCGFRLRPDNAIANRNFRPFTLRVINLVDHRSGRFYDKGIEAQKVVVSRWFNQITTAEYDQMLDNIELAFSDEFRTDSRRREVENQVRGLIVSGFVKEEQFDAVVLQMLGASANNRGVEKYVAACDKLFSRKKAENEENYERWISSFSFRLMQFNTLKDSKHVISLEDAIQRELDMEFIDDPEEIHSLNDKLGIMNMQVSCDVQIVNCTYGYCRRSIDPHKKTNNNCRLKLNAFSKDREGNANLVYGSKLDTEGILFEISQKKIVDWLSKNGLVTEEQLPDIDDDLSIKKWFAENINSDSISMYGDVDEGDRITQMVFALLHSISHAFIKTAGELSGLSSNTLTEIIIVETASIFVYAQSGQGLTLGALTGMIETNYVGFLKKAFTDTRSCVFDPICTERDDTACSACLIIPEVSCNYFNSQLGRKYLYSIDGVTAPVVGFWEM